MGVGVGAGDLPSPKSRSKDPPCAGVARPAEKIPPSVRRTTKT